MKQSDAEKQTHEDALFNLTQENHMLKMMVDEQKMSLAAKEESVTRLRTSLDEQTSLVQSLRTRYVTGGDRRGSIMDELEAMMSQQLHGQRDLIHSSGMTSALLTQLAPQTKVS